jgi:7,8-dihydropterin-6-yl-methyl-4-(beta-D-ribofuranosyl)aminobenzene 5'-phosphate synthase
MQFVRRDVWHVTFLGPGLETPLPKTLTFTDEGKICELARRGEVVGGLHLVVSTPSQIDQVVSSLLDTYHIQRTALGHCTGEKTFAILQQRLGTNYRYAGVGEVLGL